MHILNVDHSVSTNPEYGEVENYNRFSQRVKVEKSAMPGLTIVSFSDDPSIPSAEKAAIRMDDDQVAELIQALLEETG